MENVGGMKKQYIEGELPKKGGGFVQFSDLIGGLVKKRR